MVSFCDTCHVSSATASLCIDHLLGWGQVQTARRTEGSFCQLECMRGFAQQIWQVLLCSAVCAGCLKT